MSLLNLNDEIKQITSESPCLCAQTRCHVYRKWHTVMVNGEHLTSANKYNSRFPVSIKFL